MTSTKGDAIHALPIAVAIIPDGADIIAVDYGDTVTERHHDGRLVTRASGVTIHVADGGSFLAMLDRLREEGDVEPQTMPRPNHSVTEALGTIDDVPVRILVGTHALMTAAALAS